MMASVRYRGKSTTTGSSKALRIESGFFRSHPEAQGDFEVTAIGPGRFLVSFDRPAEAEEQTDPALGAFLAFLDRDMAEHPEGVTPLDDEAEREIRELIGR